MEQFDDIIIGSGQAGNPIAYSLASKGRRVALVEKGLLGGTCVNTGCTPTKAYVACARRAYVAKHSDGFGVSVKNASIDLQKIKSRKDEIIEESREGLQSMINNEEGITLIKGIAKFEGNKKISINGETYHAERVFINCGARARIPDGFAQVPYLTNKTILELEQIPEHLVIVGGGPVGIEFGQMFRRFGSKVSILEMNDQLLAAEDDDIAKEVHQILQKEGINIQLDSECIQAKKTNNGIDVTYNCANKEETLTGSHVLIATGRIPNTDLLGLKNTDIELTERGYVYVDDQCETSVENVFALGDCNGQGAFTHTSYNDYQIVNDYLFGEGERKISDRFPCYAIYLDPPLARVGMNKVQILENDIDASVATIPMDKVARAREKGETQGMLKIYIEKETGRFLGASFLGAGADEYIHTIIDQMYGKNRFTVVRDAIHIHPTVSELIPTMLENLEDVS